ncbi:MAG TPA: hypothetical protein PK680_01760 [Novosphingobium sp.]|nr:hypothetical protein [Novosphingobium sp.]HQA17087.1 hypothetical protein [Novosphingobium sp.]
MAELLVLAGIIVLIFGTMWVAYLRMIGIRDGTQSRLEVDRDAGPVITPYVDEVRGSDGMVYAREMNFDPGLSSADKRAGELPDINQTLQGKR